MVDDEVIKIQLGPYVKAYFKYKMEPDKENKEALEEAQREWYEYLETRL